MHACMHVCMHACMYSNIHAYICVCVCLLLCRIRLYRVVGGKGLGCGGVCASRFGIKTTESDDPGVYKFGPFSAWN